MKTSTIQFTIELDDKNFPEKILWNATDKHEAGASPTKAIGLSIWDPEQQNTLRIDLWTKDMQVDHMKRFYIDTIGSLAQSALQATGDEEMAREMSELCERLVKFVSKG